MLGCEVGRFVTGQDGEIVGKKVGTRLGREVDDTETLPDGVCGGLSCSARLGFAVVTVFATRGTMRVVFEVCPHL